MCGLDEKSSGQRVEEVKKGMPECLAKSFSFSFGLLALLFMIDNMLQIVSRNGTCNLHTE